MPQPSIKSTVVLWRGCTKALATHSKNASTSTQKAWRLSWGLNTKEVKLPILTSLWLRLGRHPTCLKNRLSLTCGQAFTVHKCHHVFGTCPPTPSGFKLYQNTVKSIFKTGASKVPSPRMTVYYPPLTPQLAPTNQPALFSWLHTQNTYKHRKWFGRLLSKTIVFTWIVKVKEGKWKGPLY